MLSISRPDRELRMNAAEIIERAAPWLGGGAMGTLAIGVMYLWMKYFRRNDEQWEQSDRLLDDVRQERDHWRDMAMSRQDTIQGQREILSSLRTQYADLKSSYQTMKTDIDDLRSENRELREELEGMRSRLEE